MKILKIVKSAVVTFLSIVGLLSLVLVGKSYYDSLPPLKAGECLAFEFQAEMNTIKVQLKISANDDENGTSAVIQMIDAEDMFGHSTRRIQTGIIKYEDIKALQKEYNAKKVPCEAIAE